MTKQEKNRDRFNDGLFLVIYLMGTILSGIYLWFGNYDHWGKLLGGVFYTVCLFNVGFLIGKLSNSTEKD